MGNNFIKIVPFLLLMNRRLNTSLKFNIHYEKNKKDCGACISFIIKCD